MLDKYSAEKKKQFIYMIAAIGGISAAMILLSSAFQNEQPQQIVETPKINIINKKDTDANVFRKEYGDENVKQNVELEALKKELESLKNNGAAQGQLPNGGAMPSFISPPPAPTNTEQYRIQESPKDNIQEEKKEPPKSIIMGDMIGNINIPSPVDEPKNDIIKKTKKIELPSGSFMSGILLSGLDAPTGGKAKTSPHPVLIRITNTARLPNKFRANLKECHAVGSAYGDLSSERAYVRVEKLSCMTDDGRAIEKGVAGQSFGYVSGEDGKAGLTGIVVSKQGAILARTLASGFLEGVSRAFQSSSTTYSVTSTGTVSTPNPDDTLQLGLFGGAGEASKRLADFYMKLANEMFPVVEINAGRKVDIVLLEKLNFEYDEEKKQ